MKKLLIGILLSVAVFCQGQYKEVWFAPASGGEAPPSCDDGMIDNGCFDDGTNWDLSHFTINGGTADNDGTNGYVRQTDGNMDSSVQGSTAYTFTFDITSMTSSYVSIYLFDYAGTEYYNGTGTWYSTGTGLTVSFTTPSSVGGAGLQASFQCDDVFSIDNFKLEAD